MIRDFTDNSIARGKVSLFVITWDWDGSVKRPLSPFIYNLYKTQIEKEASNTRPTALITVYAKCTSHVDSKRRRSFGSLEHYQALSLRLSLSLLSLALSLTLFGSLVPSGPTSISSSLPANRPPLSRTGHGKRRHVENEPGLSFFCFVWRKFVERLGGFS